ncbi:MULTISPECIES: hypothetical protein [unclassified Coleofasciculus]|uniref:hypothetical protein n=1 Tax=unclassified Coleofasciculus TaxID=2692782 RepID=UPI001881CE26|nr:MULTISPECIES: hypothetical protein [unclassified Coleofasciculus]MBE9129470.1 hypothetical protein [Coleofasciculus sp. LEGE 07081]MBE9152094.1 hypothetical protein [Coleofasciculus sp. LEGE 07092]
MIESTVRKQIAPLSLFVLLGCTGVGWLTTTAIIPQVAQAYTARVDVSIRTQPNETYGNLLRRAEAVARAAAQRSFDGDILVTDVAVTIIGEHDGAVAPVLLLDVSRQNWRNRPETQYWATYFPSTELLLGFEQPTVQPQGQFGEPNSAPQRQFGEPDPPPQAEPAVPPEAQPGVPQVPGVPPIPPPPRQFGEPD